MAHPNLEIDTSSPPALETVASNFETVVDQAIAETWAPNLDGETYFQSLVTNISLVGEASIHLGDEVQAAIKDQPSYRHHAIHFLWFDELQSFLILWRDILFEATKAEILYQEDKINSSRILRLKEKSKEVVQQAADSLKEQLDIKNNNSDLQKKQLRTWMLQQTPYPVYKQAIQALSTQCQELLTTHQTTLKTSHGLNEIKELIEKSLLDLAKEFSLIKDTAQKAKELVDGYSSHADNKIANLLTDLEQGLPPLFDLQDFQESLVETASSLPRKLDIPVGLNDGMVQVKNINFQRSTRQWLEAELLPVLFELLELADTNRGRLSLLFQNIKNRITIQSQEEDAKQLNYDDILIPLDSFIKKVEDQIATLETTQEEVTAKVNHSLGLFAVYQEDQLFLPVPLQASISQLQIQQSQWYVRTRDWIKRQFSLFRSLQSSVQLEEKMSVSEKIVRLLQSRSPNQENHHYNTLFLTEGFIGESFWLGREQELLRVERLIEQWQLGYRGAILLTGQRFAGKTLMGELISRKYFPKNTIRLSPNTSITFQGRHFDCQYDLGDCLEFIRKYTVSSSVLVWIDDLELWQDANTSLSYNFRRLSRAIDQYSRQSFFMVSMGNGLKNHYQSTHQINKIFQAEINLDQMALEEIQEAILIRHGATHKTLVTEEGEEISPKEFQKAIRNIHQAAAGNIGEALIRWVAAIHAIDEEKVTFKNLRSYQLPEFTNTDSGILLTTLILEKSTNEYRLRKIFGPAFKEKYQGILQRLVSIGIVKRDSNDWLSINDVIANDLSKRLDQKKFLKL